MTTTRSRASLIVALFLLFHGIPQAVLADEANNALENRPNIILMMCDDLGWADVGYQGSKIAQTPNIDALAKKSLVFSRFYAQSAVCSPTRGSCLTGRNPNRYGIFHANVGNITPYEILLSEKLKKAGYRTGHFGKWHLGTLTLAQRDSNRGNTGDKSHYSPPWDNGFDRCFSTEAKVPTFDPMFGPKGRNKRGPFWNPLDDDQRSPYGTHYWNEKGEKITDPLTGDDSKIIMHQALNFMEDCVKTKKPFFTVIWFHAPHLPVVADAEHRQPFVKKTDAWGQHYFGCIKALDEQVGRLMTSLEKWNVAQNTMLWFTSDNGPEGQASRAPGSAQPLRGRKRDLFEGGIRVPGLLYWPARVTQSRSTDIPACTSDYFPTILDALKIPHDDQRPLDGTSLLPLIDQKVDTLNRKIFFEFAGNLALIENQYKCVILQPKKSASARPSAVSLDSKAQVLLFDIPADASEKKDLASANAQRLEKMKKEILTWRASCRQSRAKSVPKS